MKSLKLRVRKTMFVFIAATGVFVLLFAQWRTHSQALMSARAENLTTPLLGLTTAQRADFDAGLAEFQAVETIAEGLGPVFNGKSCAECHAVPSVGGAEPNLGVARETRIARLFNGVFDPLDGSVSIDKGGRLLQQRAIDLPACHPEREAVPPEATLVPLRLSPPSLGPPL